MRLPLARSVLVGSLAAVALLGGCSSSSDDTSPSDFPSASDLPSDLPPSIAPDLPDGSGDATEDPDLGDTAAIGASPACDEVRAGIAAFNDRDYDETVARFEAAVPLARRAAATDQSLAATALLDAVTYYAELAPADYLPASASSAEFERNKQITLGLCGDGALPDSPDAPVASPTEQGIPA